VSGKSVLIVDDDLSIRGMMRSILRREGFVVDEVGSGNDAIARLTEKLYDAVVLDVMMRDGSGHDVLHALSSLRPSVKCVVVVSALSQAKIDELPHANVQARLRKPFDIGALVTAVDRCVTAGSDPPSPVD
jgi:CheY-like chemotaxis protein